MNDLSTIEKDWYLINFFIDLFSTYEARSKQNYCAWTVWSHSFKK